MASRRVVVLPLKRQGVFGQFAMPDGSSALVVDRGAHKRALRAADVKLGRIIERIRREAADGARRSG